MKERILDKPESNCGIVGVYGDKQAAHLSYLPGDVVGFVVSAETDFTSTLTSLGTSHILSPPGSGAVGSAPRLGRGGPGFKSPLPDFRQIYKR